MECTQLVCSNGCGHFGVPTYPPPSLPPPSLFTHFLHSGGLVRHTHTFSPPHFWARPSKLLYVRAFKLFPHTAGTFQAGTRQIFRRGSTHSAFPHCAFLKGGAHVQLLEGRADIQLCIFRRRGTHSAFWRGSTLSCHYASTVLWSKSLLSKFYLQPFLYIGGLKSPHGGINFVQYERKVFQL